MANPTNVQLANLQKAEMDIILKEEMEQVEQADSLESAADNAMFSPMRIQRNFTTLSERVVAKKGQEKEAKKTEETEEIIPQVEGIDAVAEQFQEKNPELQASTLLVLRARISEKDSPEDILKKVLEIYPDYSLADEALEFLIRTSPPKLAEKLKEVRSQFYALHKREILAGKNIASQAREFSSMGLGTPTALRDLYRDVTLNPKDPATRFQEFTDTYPFDKLKTVIAFILHSLGSDLKSKGPSIEKGELSNLMTETKIMQAILGVYRFFKSRMPLIMSSYEREGYNLPSTITFESLSKLFVKLLLERYPSAEKIYLIGVQLGIQDEWIAEAIIFMQMRDAIRQIAPRLFRSEQHRQDILTLFLDVLKELEEKDEEEEEEDDE